MADAAPAVADQRSKLEKMKEFDEHMQKMNVAAAELKARFEHEKDKIKVANSTVMNGWRDIMRLVKVEQHRGELETASKMFQRDMERKDAAILDAIGALADAEDHEKYVIRVHAGKLDTLIELQKRRASDMHTAFVAQVSRMKREHEAERAGIIASHTSLQVDIMQFMRAVRQEQEAKLTAIEAEAAENKEAQRRKALERIHALQTDMDAAIEILEKAFEEAHSKYLNNTDQRTVDFKNLSARGQHDTQMKERQRRAIKRLQLRLQYHQNKLAYLSREAEEKNGALQAERDSIGRQLLALKQRWVVAQEGGVGRMKALAASSTAMKRSLSERLVLGQQILATAEAVRPLEPAEVRVNPFAAPAAPAAEFFEGAFGGAGAMPAPPLAGPGFRAADDDAAAAAAAVPKVLFDDGSLGGGGLSLASSTLLDRSLMDRMSDEPEALANFYGRFNQAALQELAAQQRLAQLRAENASLHATLRTCMDATSLAPTTVDAPNTLVVVNGRTGIPRNAHMAPAPAAPASTNIEAGAAVRAVLKQTTTGGIRSVR